MNHSNVHIAVHTCIKFVILFKWIKLQYNLYNICFWVYLIYYCLVCCLNWKLTFFFFCIGYWFLIIQLPSTKFLIQKYITVKISRYILKKGGVYLTCVPVKLYRRNRSCLNSFIDLVKPLIFDKNVTANKQNAYFSIYIYNM